MDDSSPSYPVVAAVAMAAQEPLAVVETLHTAGPTVASCKR